MLLNLFLEMIFNKKKERKKKERKKLNFIPIWGKAFGKLMTLYIEILTKQSFHTI